MFLGLYFNQLIQTAYSAMMSLDVGWMNGVQFPVQPRNIFSSPDFYSTDHATSLSEVKQPKCKDGQSPLPSATIKSTRICSFSSPNGDQVQKLLLLPTFIRNVQHSYKDCWL
jgi:hypothetical protein